MSSREDVRRFYQLPIYTEALGLQLPESVEYFCTPVGAEHIGDLGADGVHFVFLPGNERVFCVDPSMGEEGTYVLPVAENFRQFLQFLLFCRDVNPISQIARLTEERFRSLLQEEADAYFPGQEELLRMKERGLAAIRAEFSLTAADPFPPVKAMQAHFHPDEIEFSDEYYDVLGLARP